MDFFFLYNLVPDATVDTLKKKLDASESFKSFSGCFTRTGLAFANLTSKYLGGEFERFLTSGWQKSRTSTQPALLTCLPS
jgi:hypothetical protein